MAFKGLCDYIGPTWTIKANLPILKSSNLIISAKNFLPYNMRYSVSRVVLLFGGGDSWEEEMDLICPTTPRAVLYNILQRGSYNHLFNYGHGNCQGQLVYCGV